MFVSFSQTISKFGGGRLGLGIRITKKNALWSVVVVFCVAIIQLAWYVLLFECWLIYVIFRWLYLCIKKLIVKIKATMAARKK